MRHLQDRMAGWHETGFGAALSNAGHFAVFAIRRFFNERMNNAAASLTYSTLLALVPLLVIAFAILSSFPAFDDVKDRMQALVFGAVVPEAGATISEYLSNFTTSASNLTAVGVVALAVTALMLLSTIEDTLNRVWHVERPRPILVRFLIFWTVLTMGPLLFGASFTLTADFAAFADRFGVAGLGARVPLRAFIGGVLSTAISIVGFTALFVLVPARRVRIAHAALGATFSAIAFKLLSWGFNAFLTSGSSYETIYGAVAAVPLFLIWIYTSWMVIILGAVVAAALPDWWSSRTAIVSAELKPPEKLAIAIALLARLQRQSRRGGTLDEAVLSEAVPLEARELVDALHASGYLVQTEDGRVALARDLHTATAFDLAADLGLSLGIARDRASDLEADVFARLSPETESIREMLVRLLDCERHILGRPIVEIIAAK